MMTWTTQKPTRPGWYWYRDLPFRTEFVVNVCELVTGELFASADGFDQYVERLSGEWAGPLEVPHDAL
jgi:hypothetical protein